jgi:hypothetical protein
MQCLGYHNSYNDGYFPVKSNASPIGQLTAKVHALAIAVSSKEFLAQPMRNKKTKVQKSNKISTKNFQPGVTTQ